MISYKHMTQGIDPIILWLKEIGLQELISASTLAAYVIGFAESSEVLL